MSPFTLEVLQSLNDELQSYPTHSPQFFPFVTVTVVYNYEFVSLFTCLLCVRPKSQQKWKKSLFSTTHIQPLEFDPHSTCFWLNEQGGEKIVRDVEFGKTKEEGTRTVDIKRWSVNQESKYMKEDV